MPSHDITDLVVAARTGGPRALHALAAGFSGARLHLPLETLTGIKNRPETALELGARLPVHWLQLDTSVWALPAFTRPALCRECAKTLSWHTDGRGIKTLAVSGSIASTFFGRLFENLEVDRVILNPATDAELHLARTDVEAIEKVKQRAALWFYTRDGHLKQPVTIGESSLMSTFLAKAEGALKRIADATIDEPDGRSKPESAEILGGLERGPLASLSAAIYQLLLREPVESMGLEVVKSGGTVSVQADPHPGSVLLGAIEQAARQHLAEQEGDIEARFHVTGSSIVMASSSSSTPTQATADPNLAPSPRRRKVFDYIPLEPEAGNPDHH